MSITYQVIDLPVVLNEENLAPQLTLDTFQEPNAGQSLPSKYRVCILNTKEKKIYINWLGSGGLMTLISVLITVITDIYCIYYYCCISSTLVLRNKSSLYRH